MKLTEKKQALFKLGRFFESCLLQSKGEEPLSETNDLNDFINEGVNLIETVYQENSWFSSESVKTVFSAWSQSLNREGIDQWLAAYSLDNINSEDSKEVGVIMAGNIPLVGLHDVLCVLLSNHTLKAKVSTKDKSLMLLILKVLTKIEPKWSDKIILTERLNDLDYLIATGSDNSARYFDYYFRNVKKIIRKNRTSVAVLDGEETDEHLKELSHDIFTHYGLGCRNVTKVYAPKGFDLDRLFNAFYPYKEIANHNKYANNYDYNKAVYLLNKIDLIENGFLLLKEDESLHSPVGVLFYQYYGDKKEVENILMDHSSEIQAVVGKSRNQVPFGKAQKPDLWDYADGVDTLNFLLTN